MAEATRLAKVDERASQMSMSRAACMSPAIFQWLETGAGVTADAADWARWSWLR